jgi:putative transposase
VWRRKLGGMEVSDARKLKALGEENAWLKRIVADQAFDVSALNAIAEKNW